MISLPSPAAKGTAQSPCLSMTDLMSELNRSWIMFILSILSSATMVQLNFIPCLEFTSQD